MRARNIKPGFFTNEQLAECDPLARILFAGLWCMADREGRLEDRPKRIRAEVIPYDNCDVDSMLSRLHELGLIVRYEVGGQRIIQVVHFAKHQNPHPKEAASEIPSMDQKPCKGTSQTAMDEASAGLIPIPSSSLIPIPSSSLIPQNPDQGLESPEPEGSVVGIDRPSKPEQWPSFLSAHWNHCYAGTAPSQRDPIALTKFFTDLLLRFPGEKILQGIKAKRPKTQTPWDFEKWLNGSRAPPQSGKRNAFDVLREETKKRDAACATTNGTPGHNGTHPSSG